MLKIDIYVEVHGNAHKLVANESTLYSQTSTNSLVIKYADFRGLFAREVKNVEILQNYVLFRSHPSAFASAAFFKSLLNPSNFPFVIFPNGNPGANIHAITPVKLSSCTNVVPPGVRADASKRNVCTPRKRW